MANEAVPKILWDLYHEAIEKKESEVDLEYRLALQVFIRAFETDIFNKTEPAEECMN